MFYFNHHHQSTHNLISSCSSCLLLSPLQTIKIFAWNTLRWIIIIITFTTILFAFCPPTRLQRPINEEEVGWRQSPEDEQEQEQHCTRRTRLVRRRRRNTSRRGTEDEESYYVLPTIYFKHRRRDDWRLEEDIRPKCRGCRLLDRWGILILIPKFTLLLIHLFW